MLSSTYQRLNQQNGSKINLKYLLQAMQSNNPKDFQPPQRERPLQKSMFLPDHYPSQPYIHQNQPSNELPQYNPLKRSLLDNTPPNSLNSQYQFRNQNSQSYTVNGYPSNLASGQFITLEQRASSHHELLHHSNSTNNLKTNALLERAEISNEYLPKSFVKVEKQPLSQIKPLQKMSGLEYSQRDGLINEIVNQIKEIHLSGLILNVKKQLSEDIKKIMSQFNQFRDQFKSHLLKQQAINNQHRKNHHQISKQNSPQSNKNNDINSRETNNELAQLQKQYFLLQGKLKKIETTCKGFGEQFSKIYSKFQQKTKNQGQKSFKISHIKSTLPSVMLEYKQLFSIKKGNNDQHRRTNEQVIMLSTCQYYVDRQGFLMDQENNYLLDQRGNQIRLEEKHIKLLEHHKILHR